VVNDIREDLDRALRTVTFGEAPVEQARRAGRRLRSRRRLTAVAAVLVVAAVAAGYPALTRNSAAGRPVPFVGSAKPTPGSGHDMVVTAGPPGQITQAAAGLTDQTGQVAEGAVGDLKWQVTVVPPGQKNPVSTDSCYLVTINVGASDIMGNCNDIPAGLGGGLGDSKPAAFTELDDNGTTVTTVGEAAGDVTYFIVTFADAQQLKLLPVTVGGHRYVAWMAPLSMTIDSVVAHLGGPYFDSGLTATAVPFEQPGGPPVIGLWQPAGQAVPPRGTRVIGAGTVGGPWRVTAYEGPWGTCFVTDPIGSECVPAARLNTTKILGWAGVSPIERGFGSAAPGVASVRVTLSNGKTVMAHPVRVGDEDLFAFPTGNQVSPVGWTTYDAAGQQVGSGSTAAKP
jgi:hypothetical protein